MLYITIVSYEKEENYEENGKNAGGSINNVGRYVNSHGLCHEGKGRV